MFEAGVPFVHPRDARTHILGELWEVTDPVVIANLDKLEGHPEWYVRTSISVVVLDGALGVSVQTADIYFNAQVSDREGEGIVVSNPAFVESGDFRSVKQTMR